MTEELLSKILDSNLSQETKDKIFEFWMLPESNTSTPKTPIQKIINNDSRVGSIKRPSKEELDLRADPRKQEEIKEMEETLDEIV